MVLTGTSLFYPLTAFQLVSQREAVLTGAEVILQTPDGTPVVVEGRDGAGKNVRIPWHAIEYWTRADATHERRPVWPSP